MIVNETFARRFFGDRSPIGRTVRSAERVPATIVGAREGQQVRHADRGQKPYFYLPFRQRFAAGAELRLPGQDGGRPDARRAGAAPCRRWRSTRTPSSAPCGSADAIGYSLYVPMLAASLLSVVGVVCLLLAAVGLYSVISYAVSQRDAGVRRSGWRSAPAPGTWCAWWRARACGSPPRGCWWGSPRRSRPREAVGGMLVGVGAADPSTFGAAALFLLAVTLLASYWPARRAARVDPMSAMRSQ